MRPENILAWSINVEVGAPPPSQPPFDQFGNPIVNITANIKEWKREFQAQQVERNMQERVFWEEKVGDGPKIGSSKADIEAYIKGWKSASGREDKGGEGERNLGQQNPNTSKTSPSAPDIEAHWNHTRKQNFEAAERKRILRQRKILFPHTVPAEVKPEPKAFKIPQIQRKPIPRSSSDDTAPHALHPQTLLLRNGETKRVERVGSYTERVRELGYPDVLCPLPMKGLGIDCTGARVVGRSDVGERDSDGNETPLQSLGFTPEVLALRGEFRTLKVGQKRG